MKDIKDFFKSSIKSPDINTSSEKDVQVETVNENLESYDNTPKKLDKNDEKNEENYTKTKKLKKQSSRTSIRGKRGEKITEVHPQDSPQSINEKENQNLENEISNECIIEDSDETSNPATPKAEQLNAFQFLMNSRNKVIGSNSPGKEQPPEYESLEDSSSIKTKLSARKQLLQSWSDKKKSNKRKMEDDEIDKCIKIKLGIRKKRFKAMLKVDDDEAVEEITVLKSSEDKHHKRQSSLTNFVKTTNNSDENDMICMENEHKVLTDEVKYTSHIVKQIKINSDDDFEDEKVVVEGESESKSLKRKRYKQSKHKKKIKEKATPKSPWKLRIKLASDSSINDQQNNIETSEKNTVIDVEDNIENNHVIEISNEEIINEEKTANLFNIIQKEKGKIVENSDVKEKGKREHSDIAPFKRVLRDRSSLKKCLNSNFEESVSDECSNDSSEKSFEVKRNLKSNRLSSKKQAISLNVSSEDSNDSFQEPVKSKKISKVAPVFVKAIPKPKIDPEILEAKKRFLMSEMPETLRKKVEKQTRVDLPDFDVFPKISHVRQESEDEHFWNLQCPNIIPLTSIESLVHIPQNYTCEYLLDKSFIAKSRYPIIQPLSHIKKIVRNLKLENPNYPVYKSFRLIKEKCDIEKHKPIDKNTPKRKSKSKKIKEISSDTNGNNTIQEETPNISEFDMWTEKYKPRSSEDFMGNIQAIGYLKKWLEGWHEAFKSGKCRVKNYSSDSDSAFICSDTESLSERSLDAAVILSGPHGTGKSSSVYAICNEMGLDVIELNASGRRTGKQVLQEFQEATQSHQVRKNKESILGSKKQRKKTKSDNAKEKRNKMCVLLIEDIDIVFEQDEGLISAISQISTVTKRPIVLTTSDEKSVNCQRFIGDFKNIKFYPFSSKSLGLWLHILCLVEGIFVDAPSIEELLEYNRGDVRKTMLEIQFWVQSGGQISKHKNSFEKSSIPIDIDNRNDIECLQVDDEASNMSLKEQENEIELYRTHANVISDFEIFQSEKFYNIPKNANLKSIWWNIPNFLNFASKNVNFRMSKTSKRKKNKLKAILDMYNSMCIADTSYRKVSFECDKPICQKRWNSNPLQDSLELEEINEGYTSNRDFLFEWNHYLMDGCLNICKEKFVNPALNSQRLFNMGLPGCKFESNVMKNHRHETNLMNAVPQLSVLDRKTVSLDYLPSLRTIARSEKIRSQNNMKRHNRFYNYLQNFNVDCNNELLDFATQSLAIKNDD